MPSLLRASCFFSSLGFLVSEFFHLVWWDQYVLMTCEEYV
jgi:hypothetical protein